MAQDDGVPPAVRKRDCLAKRKRAEAQTRAQIRWAEIAAMKAAFEAGTTVDPGPGKKPGKEKS